MSRIKSGELALILLIMAVFALVLFAQTAFYFDIDSKLAARRQEESFTAALPAVHDENALFGNLEIRTKSGASLPKAELLLNGLVSGNFSDGGVLVRVYENDVVTIDASAYDRALEFVIANHSRNIDDSKLEGPFVTKEGKVAIGIISFK